MIPVSEQEFDDLVDDLMVLFPKIKDKDHAAAVVSVAVRHLPNDQATSTFEYFGYCVLKSLANHVANFKGEKVKHETQVAQYANALTVNPTDAQAYDQLVKWSNEGSTAAKKALADRERKEPVTDGSNVLPIKAQSQPTNETSA